MCCRPRQILDKVIFGRCRGHNIAQMRALLRHCAMRRPVSTRTPFQATACHCGAFWSLTSPCVCPCNYTISRVRFALPAVASQQFLKGGEPSWEDGTPYYTGPNADKVEEAHQKFLRDASYLMRNTPRSHGLRAVATNFQVRLLGGRGGGPHARCVACVYVCGEGFRSRA